MRCLSTLAFVAALLTIAHANSQESFVGRRVLAKRRAVSVYRDEGGRKVEVGKVGDSVVEVLDDNEGWLKVRHGREPAWLVKSDVVPLDGAVAYFTRRIRAAPTDAWNYAQRGLAGRLAQKWPDAVKDYTQAITLDPGEAGFLVRRAQVYSDLHRPDEAIADYTEAIRIDPSNATAHFHRGTLFLAKKDYPRAFAGFQQTVNLLPQHIDALDRLAWVWATCPRSEWRNGPQAVRAAEQACKLSDWKDPDRLATLAAAYAEAGDFPQAIKWQQRVVELTARGDDEALRSARLRLALYTDKKPFHSE
jgi:tetratricopeptide (TPR) repeat protein